MPILRRKGGGRAGSSSRLSAPRSPRRTATTRRRRSRRANGGRAWVLAASSEAPNVLHDRWADKDRHQRTERQEDSVGNRGLSAHATGGNEHHGHDQTGDVRCHEPDEDDGYPKPAESETENDRKADVTESEKAGACPIDREEQHK